MSPIAIGLLRWFASQDDWVEAAVMAETYEAQLPSATRRARRGRLVRAHLVEHRTEEDISNLRGRRDYYRITPKGRTALETP